MGATKATDEEILALLRQGATFKEIAKAHDITYNGAFSQRIRRVCKENSINPYEHLTHPSRGSGDAQTALLRLKADRRVKELTIKDGCILVGTDPHYSRIDHVSVAHKAFCNLLSDLKSSVVAVILNGDIADFGCVSRFPRGPWRNPKRPTVKDELEAVQERLSEIENQGSKNIPYLRTLGNHDDRLEAKLSAISESLEGLYGTRLSDHIPRWVECERIDINGDCEAIHNIRAGEIGRDRQNVLATGHHTIVGHSHQLHVWPQSWRRGTFFGVCAGTLADLDDEVFSYLGSRPANWQSGLVLLTWVDGILQYPECGAVIDGKLYFRGTRYA